MCDDEPTFYTITMFVCFRLLNTSALRRHRILWPGKVHSLTPSIDDDSIISKAMISNRYINIKCSTGWMSSDQIPSCSVSVCECRYDWWCSWLQLVTCIQLALDASFLHIIRFLFWIVICYFMSCSTLFDAFHHQWDGLLLTLLLLPLQYDVWLLIISFHLICCPTNFQFRRR